MTDLSFMAQTFAVKVCLTHFMDDIKILKSEVKAESDPQKLRQYFNAVKGFRDAGIRDLVQFALSYGRKASGKAAPMRAALPVMLGYEVTQPSAADLSYAKLLLAYAMAFQENASHLKEWTLRVVLTSRFSPIKGLYERELNNLIENTKNNITRYEASLR